jgi:F420-non-reducing hydrogenase small subunit
MKPQPKTKVGVFTATGCRSCEQAILDLHYQVNPLHPWADFVFWPYLLGSDWDELSVDKSLDVCFFCGAIRTEEDLAAAQLLRDVSHVLVACGACAAFGGLPGLANLNGDVMSAQSEKSEKGEGPSLPRLTSRVQALDQAVEVDYTVPGCAPPQNLLWASVQALVCGGQAPARQSYAASRLPEAMALAVADGMPPRRGSVFAGEKAVCASCSRSKEEKRFNKMLRPYEKYEETGRCLLEQGLVCQGLATREGCGGLCTGAGIPCRGCFGKPEAVFDPGAKMVSAVASTFDSTNPEELMEMGAGFLDLSGTFYRYTLPSQCALLSRSPQEIEDA